MKIGILGTSEIAFRRFLPALLKSKYFTYAGVASRTVEKGKKFQEEFGGKIYDGYDELLADETIEAVYVPLPPALHYEWGKKVLEAGKHLLMEKPFTTSQKETQELISLAKKKNLAVYENYMFVFHSQLDEIKKIVLEGIIGDIRLYRMAFCFPRRDSNDFRYNKQLGGGSLLDCGGYPIKYASMLLGESTKVAYSKLNYLKDFEVDMYGTATLINDDGLTAQVAFGMDNSYKCELEIIGSKGTLKTNRIFTAPTGYKPSIEININNEIKNITLEEDDTFYKSINCFKECIENIEVRNDNYNKISKQAKLVDAVKGK